MIKNISITIFLLTIFFNSQSQTLNYKIDSIPVSGNGGWDYIAVNHGKIFTSHSTAVNILDEKTGDSVSVIEGTTGVHGIAFYNPLNKIYTSNGRLNNVFVIDGTTYKKLKEIPTGQNPDAIFFESFSKKIITCNAKSNSLSIIDPITDEVVATIPLDGNPETAVSDGKGKVFVNIEDKNEIGVIDIKLNKVEVYWPITPGTGATGLAIDTVTNRLFAGCDNELMVVMDASDGKIITHLPIDKNCDGVVFDQERKLIFTANGEGTVTVIKEFSTDSYKVIGTIPTMASARTITLNPQTHHLFLPAALLEPTVVPGERRRRIVSGSFRVLRISVL